MDNIDVSVILVNYNTQKMTSECIDSIISHTSGVKYEIILVDNGSKDGSKELFTNDKRVKYIYSSKNGGFGYGNNRGMEVAKGRYFFLLNTDTLLKNNAVKEFFDYAESHEARTVYGCYLEGKDGKYRVSFCYFPAFTIVQFVRRLFCRQSYIPTYKITEVECISGADMFLPRNVFEECGGFDEHIFLYGEECEWQYRMMLRGFHRMLITTPKIIHFEGASVKDSPKLHPHWDSHFYVLGKYMNRPTYWLARAYYFVRCGAKIKKVI